MGVVYRARHERLSRVRALKLLPQELVHDQAFRERFEREWRLAASIEHPNIVDVLDAGETGEHLYILMQFVDGPDLNKLVEQEGPLSPERALHILDQIADALDAAHAQGLIHRDVTPRNILVAAGDRAYLADFGVARASGTHGVTQKGFFVGNLDYAAPEQIEGKEVDGRADIYALGGCLYTALCGAPPYERESDVQLMYAHLRDPAPAPSVRRPELPKAIDRVVSTAMAKSPDERYGSCGELADDLRTAIGAASGPATVVERRPVRETRHEEPVDTGKDGGRRPSRRPSRRTLLIGAAVIVLAGAAAGVAVALVGGGGSGRVALVRGTVVDADSGRPLSGVSVSAGDREAKTGPGGEFRLEDVQKGATVTVSSACGSSSTAEAGKEPVTLRLTPLAFTGKATNALTGKGLANQEVDFGGRTTTTDASGNFRVSGLCVGQALPVSVPDRPFKTTSVRAPDSRNIDVVFEAKPAAEAFGDPNHSWFPALSDRNETSFYKNGEFHMLVTRPNWTTFVVSSFNPESLDSGVQQSVAMTMRARQVTSVLGHYGFSCFDDDVTHGYTLSYRTDGFFDIVKWSPNQEGTALAPFLLVGWTPTPFIRRGTSENRVSATCRILSGGVSLVMRANGHELTSYRDTAGFLPTRFGFEAGTEPNVSSIEVAFDDFRLQRLG